MPSHAHVTAKATSLLFAQSRTTLFASFVLSVVMLTHGWDIPLWEQWTWALLVNVISLLRFTMAQRYLSRSPEEQRELADHWLRRGVLGAFLAGSSWSIGLSLTFLGDNFADRMFVLMLTAGLVAGAMGANFSVRKAFYAFSVPILAPMVVFSALHLERLEDVLATLALLLFIFTVVRTVSLVSNSIAENLTLVDWQQRAMQELEATRDAATTAARSRSDFIAVMSHEIRTPLNGVVGMTALLERTGLNSEQRDSVEVIKTSADALLGLVNDILDLSKIDAGGLQLEPASVALHDELARLMRLFEPRACEKGLSFELQLGLEVPQFVMLDWARVRQVLINLAGNALKFTATGFVRCRVSARGGMLRFEVEDSGVGMSEAAVSKLFAPFTQADRTVHRRFGGTGLGLSISRKVARLMNGDVTVDSVEGRGSNFIFTLPLVRGVRPTPAPVVIAQRARRMKVLVADDNAVNLRVTTRLLELDGHQVSTAVNGEEAVVLARREAFDVALLDIQMPVLDGLEAARCIRREGIALRLVALTANASTEDRQACALAGFDDFLTKPLAPPTLAEALARTDAASQPLKVAG